MAPFTLGKNVDSAIIGGSVLSISIRSNRFIVLYRSSIPLKIIFLPILLNIDRGVLNCGFIYLLLKVA